MRKASFGAAVRLLVVVVVLVILVWGGRVALGGSSAATTAALRSFALDVPAESIDGDALPGDQQRIARWAVDLFALADLDLPPLSFEYHPEDVGRCLGRLGVHLAREAGSVIRVCTSEASFAVQVIILHELAHAWADHSLSTERRAAFKALRGWEHWRNYDEAAWHENGTEQAAELIVWGLIDRPLAMARIDQNSCADLEAGYRTLTGQAPLHGLSDLCERS